MFAPWSAAFAAAHVASGLYTFTTLDEYWIAVA
jgi:hypothetical protein